jgi:CMP-N-acetylneuraminic acid synthetase
MDQNNPRQSYPKTYVPNGYIDIVKPEIFMNGDNLYGEKIYSYVTNLTQEIDTIEDFEYIEYLIKNKKYV